MYLHRRLSTLTLGVCLATTTCSDAGVPIEGNLTPQGGEFTFGPVTVVIPPDAVTGQHVVTISAATGAPASNRVVGQPVRITVEPAVTLLKAATIQIDYSGLTIPSRIPAATLDLHRAEGGGWVALGGTNDAQASTVSVEVTTFSDFGLLGRRAESVEALSPASQTGTPGGAAPSPPSVRVLDQDAAPLGGITVAFAVTAGGGTITPSSTATNASGVASATSWTLGSTAGTNTATATAADLSATTFTVTTTSGGALDVYFNSSEQGCNGSDASALFCDDFESGFWYTVDADHIFSTGGGLAAQKGWYGNIYANPITPPGAAVCGSVGFRSNCAATSGYLDGHAGGRNMADHGFVGNAQLTEAWFRLYVRPQSDYNGGHEKMFDFTRGPATGQMVALCYNYFGSETIRCIPYLHQDDGLPGPPPGGAWMGSNMAAVLTMIPTHWYFIEMHVKLNTPGSYDGVFDLWMDDCGTNGLACSGTPTLRGRYTNVKYLNTGAEATITIGGNWIENWANPGSMGTLLYDNVRASRAGPIGFVP